MGLQEYKRKRDFHKTPEPAGKVHARKKARTKATAASFVIQKHAATRLHYDFRLEMEGVLRSWAIPKGPSLDPGEKRLAVHVEDHPMEYGGFEGIIPKGQYGGGTVLLWDRGEWFPEGDPVAAYRKGHLKFRLEGEKLHGSWNLVRIGKRDGDEKENWLLIKENDGEARPGSGDAIVQDRAESVESGRELAEIAGDPGKVWDSSRGGRHGGERAATAKDRDAKTLAKAAKKGKPARTATPATALDPSSIPGARKGKIPARLEPQLATLVDSPPHGGEWVHEIKYDGYRALCELQDGEVRLLTRNGKDWTDRFGAVERAARELPARDAVLDGEVVVVQADGTTSFQALQRALGEGGSDLVYYAFDLLFLDGWDLRGAALAERKRALAALLAASPQGKAGAIRYSDHVEGSGDDFYRHACTYALEGIIAKRADLPYRAGRGKDWVKVKCLKRQEFVIVGFTDPERSREGFGALHLAVNEGGKRVYAGKVGTGFDSRTLLDLRKRLDKIETKTPAFENAPRGAEARRSHWVEPKLVGEVAFTEWTEDGVLRHPTFQGLREDKPAADVVREKARPTAEVESAPARRTASARSTAAASRTVAKKPASPASKKKAAKKAATAPVPAPRPAGKGGAIEIAGVRITNPDKVLFPEQGITKRELAEYYERIADRILPRIADRPLTLVRCPEGRMRQCFYQKHVTDQFPQSIRRVEVEEGGGKVPYGAIDSLEGLISLVQMGVLELHIWGSHRDDVEKPDYIVFDLDPDEGLAWERVVEGALRVRARLEELGLRTFLKTTGSKGLHVVAPLQRRAGWDDVKAFTKAVSESVVADEPSRYTARLPKASRKGKIFIDYLRNGRGATSVCAYSTRSRPNAPVSAPLFWEELATGVRADAFNVRNLFERLESLPEDPWKDFDRVRQSITAAMRKALDLK
jgi:bifunctional non-homologous end joining protein LigD